MKSRFHAFRRLSVFALLFSLFFTVLSASFSASAFAQTSATISIREARSRALGSVVSVAGRVSAGNEFQGTAYIQDATGGLAVFVDAFRRVAVIGDSVEISGPLSEFQAATGRVGTGLLQISGTTTTFRIVSTGTLGGAVGGMLGAIPRIAPTPRAILFADVTEATESQLVRMNNVVFTTTGTFQGATNYFVTDANGARVQVRIDARTNIPNLRIPTGNQGVTGVLGQFQGTYQLTPRFAADMNLQATVNPADTIPKTNTLDVTTWNLKWFGLPTGSNGERLGPADSLLQFRNVVRVLDSIDADIFCLQEVSNLPLFRKIADSALPRYDVVIAPWNLAQRTAYLFRRRGSSAGTQFRFDTTRTSVIATNSRWAGGRFPFMLEVRASIDGPQFSTRALRFVNIHADAGATQRDYDNRIADAQGLYDAILPFIVSRNSILQEQTILAGDFNDGLLTSIFNGLPTPYLPFVRDTTNFLIPTLALAQQGLSSFASGGALIDNIVAGRWLREAFVVGGAKVENPSFVSSYTTTTSDHFPVTARFLWSRIQTMMVSVQAPNVPQASIHVAPNPASTSTLLRYTLAAAAAVEISVVDVLGTTVIALPPQQQTAGEQNAILDLRDLPTGVYWCRVQTTTGAERFQQGVMVSVQR
jgi:endonuclease/exonuclease/phosphatase family metal-dependent hydrolase